jgi:hypothetical protein
MKLSEMNLTIMESDVLSALPKECFYEMGFDSCVWVDCFLDTVRAETGIDSKQARALLVSLEKKDFISIVGDGRDKGIELRQNGKDFLLQMNLVNEQGYAI